ncbi:MAG: class I SAM-dependent methyltransferase [Candidatus Thorarchaeota archaeon]|jgi:ubiquinone/menaquinone biosynthesis C-methylase UbiE
MDEAHLKFLICPMCGKKVLSNGDLTEGEVVCVKGHVWPITNGIPSLVHPPISVEDAKWIADYDQMAENYDELVKQYDDWLGIDMMKERENFNKFVPIEGPCKIIDVSIGTGANFFALYNQFKDQMGRFNLHGMDLSTGMLNVSQRKFEDKGISVSLTHGSVFSIPFQKNLFDIVLHSGGINTFSDIPGSLNEMLRIAKSGGIIIVVDEGLSPNKRETEEGKAIIKANTLFAANPPLEHIPEKARDVEVSYVMNETFYQVVFRK